MSDIQSDNSYSASSANDLKRRKADLRRTLRAKRRRLSPALQSQASQGLRRQLLRLTEFRNGTDIAFYLANDGEIDPWPAMLQAHRMGKRVYLPVLSPTHKGQLIFALYRPGQKLVCNRFGIPEPHSLPERLRPWWTLHLILTPLVGFTEQGDRLGMGGGFYDRTLATRKQRPVHPSLIGTAHECQKLLELPKEPWDVGLDGVATDRALYRD